jgi:hypothetical protein
VILSARSIQAVVEVRIPKKDFTRKGFKETGSKLDNGEQILKLRITGMHAVVGNEDG